MRRQACGQLSGRSGGRIRRTGESYRAKARDTCAVPLNVLIALRFAPRSRDRKLEAMAIGHGGRGFKVWIKAKGAQVGTLVTRRAQWHSVDVRRSVKPLTARR